MIPQRKKILIELTLLTLGVGFFGGVVVFPVVNDISKMTAGIQAQRRELETLYEKGQFLRILRCHIAMVEKELPRISALFAHPDHQLEFITSLETIAKNNGTSIELSLGELDKIIATISPQDIVPVTITITLHGDRDQIIRTISVLETSRPLIAIRDFSLRTQDIKDEQQTSTTATLKATSFWTTTTYDSKTKTECISTR